MAKHTKIDLAQLAREISAMNSRRKLYVVLKQELSQLDHWKDKRRGNPHKGYRTMRENTATN